MKLPLVIATIIFLTLATPVLAIYDPLTTANNRVGVHILSPDELESAAKLINNDRNGSWGYVTVPIQAADRDREKWTRFMKKAAQLEVVPILRVATIVDGSHWIRPDDNDLIDFANFMNDLPWPTQNRYVIIFNEVNRADEFGGSVSPENYADILSNAIEIFKRRSDKFFILPSALDNAAPNGGNYMRWDVYLRRMQVRQPGIFNRIDGWNSHAYPNPGFSANPSLSGSNKVDSFQSDLKFLNQFTAKKLPVFITEAGWSNQALDDRSIATYFNHAFFNAWAAEQVVAVTPFLLFAGTKPFSSFSLLNQEQKPTLAYQTIQTFAVKGQPQLEDYTPSPTPSEANPPLVETSTPSAVLTTEVLGQNATRQSGIWQKITNFFKKILSSNRFNQTLSVGAKTYSVEVVSSARDMAIGLAKYNSLEPSQGMLFELKTKSIPAFWMKNMKFDIDLVWIDDNKVVDVSRGFAVTPDILIRPKSAVNYVLELNLNSGVKVGDQVKIN